MQLCKAIGSAVVILAMSSTLTACGGSESASPATVTVTSPAAVSSSPPAATPEPPVAAPAVTSSLTPAAPPPAAVASWTMPNLIGQNLQQAQDAIQALTNFAIPLSTSTDLTGENRSQVMDRNWQVCSSSPAPGEALMPGTLVDFGVVRIDVETCP